MCGMIIKIGQILFLTFDFNKKEHPDWNPNFTPAINRLGGITKLVTSTSGRNMWAIMKFFKVLPNDPLLKSLTFSQREFIIASMNQDVKEAELASKGKKEVAHYGDDSFEKLFYSNENVDLLADGDDPDDIYKQSIKLKAKGDAEQGISEDYDQVISDRIKAAVEEKELNIKNAKAQADENWKKYIKEASNFYQDDE